MTLKRLNQLCEILDDPRVPVGALIQPSGVVPASRIEQAASRRLLLVHEATASEGLETDALLQTRLDIQDNAGDNREDDEWPELET
jgi:hypothetical protein